MDYVDFVGWRFCLMVLAAVVWGFVCQLNGRDLTWEPLDRRKGPPGA